MILELMIHCAQRACVSSPAGTLPDQAASTGYPVSQVTGRGAAPSQGRSRPARRSAAPCNGRLERLAPPCGEESNVRDDALSVVGDDCQHERLPLD